MLEQIEEELRAEGYDDEHIIKVNFEDLQFEKICNSERLNKYITGRMSDTNKANPSMLFFKSVAPQAR